MPMPFRLFTVVHDFHHTHSPDAATVEHQRRVERMLRALTEKVHDMSLDTAKLLEAARKQQTQTASLLALVATVREELTKAKADLAAAIAAGDPAAIAAAQADIDTATGLLDTDDADVSAALGENVPAAQPRA